MSSKITPTVEGGLLTAIAVILGLVSTFLPVIGLFVEFFCAVPIVVLTVRQGAGKGFVALTASFLILTMFIGPLLSMRIALSFGICGLVLGWCISKNFDAVKCFVATFITAFFAQIAAILILTFVMGINVMDSELSSVQEMFNEVFKTYEEAGVDKQAIEQIREQVAPTLKLMSYLLPFLLALMGLINAAICYLTSKWIFPKLRMKFVEPMPPFAEWRFPKIFLYLAAFSTIGVYWGSSRSWDLLYTISINVQFFSMCAAFVQGLSVLSAVADKYNLGKFWRRVFFIMSILNMLLIVIVSFTGLFDMVFDYRKKFDENED
ncbi:MAG: YybS family protein [Selenomonadaceae bacterium]|nr:YybS family protein [Selenomonadaceae bacterium]